MPSTFTNNTGIEKIADGEQTGLWGQTTNLNLDIVDRALNGSTEISLSGTTHTLTTSNGVLSDGQFAVLVFTGSPSGTNTVSIEPNTAQKLYFVRNDTAQTVILSQGSGAAVSVAPSTSRVVFTNGGGAGAAVFDITNTLAMGSVAITGGSINGTTVGATSASTGAFTALTSSGATTLNGTTIPSSVTLVSTAATQTLTNKTISGANNTLSNIANASLANSSITFGSTAQALGSTVSALNGVSLGATTASSGAFTTLTASSTATLNTLSSSGATITGGSINGATVGATTPAAGTFTSVVAEDATFARINVGANLSWNSATDAYTANTSPSTVTSVHQNMRRCLVRDDGTINYFLDAADSTKKLDGTASVLDGTDGNVMVQIPRFYFRRVKSGTTTKWEISDLPLAGYQLHPAFVKAGEIVDYRYIGAYDACFFDDSANDYKSGLNLDNATSLIDFSNDKLASVSGVFPLVGVQRAECRTLAANNGTGWHQLDFALWSAVQMLFLVEYGNFNSQTALGAGNTNGSYVASSSDQNDSPHTVAGASNTTFGNASTDGTQPSAGAKPGTAFMSYRGIENLFGNPFTWCDGINVNEIAAGNVHFTNDFRDFADGTTTGYQLITSTLPTASGFIRDIQDIDFAFLSSNNSGASSSTFITDQHFASASVARVVPVGGSASAGAAAGVFCLFSSTVAAGDRNRAIGARLCR